VPVLKHMELSKMKTKLIKDNIQTLL